ncbi:hypothetical protein magsdc_33 [Candidatus Hodgkinia cicadicola]|uniref:Uncharacterized protein n=1 Tax=Candidatus Hodgkinia cicadicola TaxID=573658 RepID=A0ABX4MHB8_9HYPH|nr:hypothetical protein magsdc_270 [Candidatus Hodgkinia cicadicola]PIM96065.1 hypothetical protein magtdc_4 [Candidatus Hodgkinia cicadicola]PIM96283.1 hypothetical protein magsdc_33 [Candidatus Hodgkinia cicadicola]
MSSFNSFRTKYKFVINRINNWTANEDVLSKIESIISKLGRAAKVKANKTNRFISKLKHINSNMDVDNKWLFN